MTDDFRLHTLAATKHDYPSKRRNGKVDAAQVNPAVWREGLRLAGGDASRLVVLDATTVVIQNRPTNGSSTASMRRLLQS